MSFRNEKISFRFFLSRYLVWKVRLRVQGVRVDLVGLEVPDEDFDDGKMEDWEVPEDQGDQEVHHGRWYQEFPVGRVLRYRP